MLRMSDQMMPVCLHLNIRLIQQMSRLIHLTRTHCETDPVSRRTLTRITPCYDADIDERNEEVRNSLTSAVQTANKVRTRNPDRTSPTANICHLDTQTRRQTEPT